MEETKYINVDNMATRLCQILKDARESMVDDENKVLSWRTFRTSIWKIRAMKWLGGLTAI